MDLQKAPGSLAHVPIFGRRELDRLHAGASLDQLEEGEGDGMGGQIDHPLLWIHGGYHGPGVDDSDLHYGGGDCPDGQKTLRSPGIEPRGPGPLGVRIEHTEEGSPRGLSRRDGFPEALQDRDPGSQVIDRDY